MPAAAVAAVEALADPAEVLWAEATQHQPPRQAPQGLPPPAANQLQPPPTLRTQTPVAKASVARIRNDALHHLHGKL